MLNFFQRLLGRKASLQPIMGDDPLEQFFTDSERARQVFKDILDSEPLSKKLLVVHGVGGVGKSTLLKMYRLSCRRRRIPVAVIGAEEDEARDPRGLLSAWADDLKAFSVALPTFESNIADYRKVQRKVETKAREDRGAFAALAGKTALEVVADIALSSIPGVGPIVGAGADVAMNWLRSFLSKAEVDFYLDPTTRLTDSFLADLGVIAARHRIVLIVDTYEQVVISANMSDESRLAPMDAWLLNIAQKLPNNVLLVLAGRHVPKWDRHWQEWRHHTEQVQMVEMTADDLQLLVRRYYAHTHPGSGEPDPQQIENVVEFARGLPLAATTVVQLWVDYGFDKGKEDFDEVHSEVVAKVAQRLLEGVPPEMRSVFEVAAVPRYFNADTLRALLDKGDADSLYAELSRWPFVRSRREKTLAVHDMMREMMNEALCVRSPRRYRELHERAAKYYEECRKEVQGDKADRLGLEWLYHRVQADEAEGIKLFQATAEELASARLANRLRVLVADVNSYAEQLENQNSRLWVLYYQARIKHIQAQLEDALQVYKEMDGNSEPKLQAYALCDLGQILSSGLYRDRASRPLQDQVLDVAHRSLNMGVPIDSKLAYNWVNIMNVHITRLEWATALSYVERAVQFFVERQDYVNLLTVYDSYRGIYARQGNWQKVYDIAASMKETFSTAGSPTYLEDCLCLPWEWTWMGRYSELEDSIRKTLKVAKDQEDQQTLTFKTRDLGLCLAMQGRHREALMSTEEGLTLASMWKGFGEMELHTARMMHGIALLASGRVAAAEEPLAESFAVWRELSSHLDPIGVYYSLSQELQGRWNEAAQHYSISKEGSQKTSRNYFVCGALTGLTRVKYNLSDYNALPPLAGEQEQLAQQYEFNDHLASLRLVQGHIAWDGHIPEWGSGFDAAFGYYQQTIIYALRYNRFLLDEALSGKPQGTPLRPIASHCLARGEEGRKMLQALAEWWQTGTNDTGEPRPDTISPIPEGIPLVQAEVLARKREPGDGSQQVSVLEQLSTALARES